jgi:hypothetical protein
VFSNLFFITLSNIGKYFPGIHFPGIHFSRNSLSKKKLLSCKQTGPKREERSLPLSLSLSPLRYDVIKERRERKSSWKRELLKPKLSRLR